MSELTSSEQIYTVEELAATCNALMPPETTDAPLITPRTIRFYQTQRLLPGPERDDQHRRRAIYGSHHLNRLLVLMQLRQARRPLSDIGRMSDVEIAEQAANIVRSGHEVSAGSQRAIPRTEVATRRLQATERVPLPETRAIVLWVNDRDNMEAAVKLWFDRNGAAIVAARSTAKALELLWSVRPTAIITNRRRVESGALNIDAGLELVVGIRRMNTSVPVIMYTAGIDETFREHASRAGATDTVTTFSALKAAMGKYGFEA